MLKQILAAAAVVTVTAGPAFADAWYGGGSVKDAPPPMAAWSWSGFYFGAHAGVLFNETDIDTVGNAPGNVTNVNIGARPGRADFDEDSFMGGGQIGYNHQMGRFVIGVEADISGTDGDENVRILGTPTPNVPGAPNPSTFVQEMEYFGTVRGRLGYAMDRTLFYVTGGYAYADIDTDVIFLTGANVLQFRGQDSDTVDGYTIGGGFEYAVTDNVTVKGEALYYELDELDVFVPNIPGVGMGSYTSSFENEGVLVRAGVNLKFNGLFNGGAGN